MQEARGENCRPVQRVFPFSEMSYNSLISAGCTRKTAKKISVCLIPWLATRWLSRFNRAISEDIMCLRVLRRPVIVLNSLKAAFELLDRRANIYSDRPRVIVPHEIFCGGLFTAMMSYGDVFVFTFLRRYWTHLSFLVGVAIVAQPMKYSQSPWSVTITQRIAKRQSSLPLPSSTTQALWKSTSSALPRLAPCLSYTIIPPLKTNMTRHLRKFMHSSIACRRLLSLGGI
jgi:hypothetical protein